MAEYKTELETYIAEKKPRASAAAPKKFRTKPDPILLKMLPDPHPLSYEEQAFFLRITEGAFGFNEHVRTDSLQTLSKDPHVKYLAPYLCNFIENAIRTNIVFPDLSLLIYSVRMAKSLLANPHVAVKEHLHVLLPAVLSCVLAKKISKYQYDNHWTLRDFSAQIVAGICCAHSNKDARKPLTTLYGGLKGLSCFGDETVKVCVLPLIPVLSKRICNLLERNVLLDSSFESRQIKRVADLIVSVAGPVLLKFRNVTDGGMSYVKEFGYLGYSLYSHVKQLEASKNKFVYLVCNQ